MGELLGGNSVSSSSMTGWSNASEVIASDKSGPKLEHATLGVIHLGPCPPHPGGHPPRVGHRRGRHD